ncbi:MAG TPA: CorA family divalent cation transporter [Caulobacteraceae bacterium]|jgi:zinc transporter
MTSMPNFDADAPASAEGLVCGYAVDGAGRLEALTAERVDAALADEDQVVWLHFDQAGPGTRAWIEQTPYVPDAAKAMLLGGDSHMRIEPAGSGLTGVVGDLHHEFSQRSDHLDVLRFYLDSDRLISARREPLTAIDKLQRSLGEGLKMERPVGLLAQFLHHVTDTLGDIMLELSDDLDKLEEEVLDGGRVNDAAERLNRVRKVAARLRRHMAPQQHALLGLMARLPGWIDDNQANLLRTAIERLGALGHDLDLVQERSRLLQEQHSARLMEQTNRNLYILSIATVLALPPTLMTGIFGMNLGGLPGMQSPMGFWWGLAGMAAVVGLCLVVLRRVKML